MQPTPSAPDLPPVQRPSAASPPLAPTPMPAASFKAAPTGVHRLRQAAGYVAGGSFALVVTICAGQLVLKPGLTPADLMATIEAQTDIGIFNQKMGYRPGEHVLNEAQYQEAIAQAQRQGAAKAELVFQRDLAAVQADKERVVGAYQTLYQRTNMIAQAGVQMEAQALQFRQQLITMTNGGRATVLMIEDGLCAMDVQEACDRASKLRSGMIEESTTLTEGKMAEKIRELMSGIDDPATFTVHDDQRRNGTPAIQR